MNLEIEKESKLSAQNRYQILSDAMDMAEEENGFINSFIYQRALYICAARILYPDLVGDINNNLIEEISPIIVWDKMLEEGIIDQMIAEYQADLDLLADEGQVWFDEYAEASHSMRAMVDAIQILIDGLANNAEQQMENFKKDVDFQNVVDIANKWGMNNEEGSLL